MPLTPNPVPKSIVSSISYVTPIEFDWTEPTPPNPIPMPPSLSTLIISKVPDMALKKRNIEHIKTVKGVCNDERVTQWDLSFYRHVKSLTVADTCFKYITDFRLDGFSHLESVSVGINSFSSSNGIPSTSRHALCAVWNCPCLQSLQIGDDSFSDFGQFSLKSNSMTVNSC